MFARYESRLDVLIVTVFFDPGAEDQAIVVVEGNQTAVKRGVEVGG